MRPALAEQGCPPGDPGLIPLRERVLVARLDESFLAEFEVRAKAGDHRRRAWSSHALMSGGCRQFGAVTTCGRPDTIINHVQPAAVVRAARRSPLAPLRCAVTVATMVVLLSCGTSLAFIRLADRTEARKANQEISRYLTLVQMRDRAAADAMLCGGDDTSLAELPNMGETGWHLPSIEAFAIVGSWGWSSMADGHGIGYRVRLEFADGSSTTVDLAVEVIADTPCIATEIPF